MSRVGFRVIALCGGGDVVFWLWRYYVIDDGGGNVMC